MSIVFRSVLTDCHRTAAAPRRRTGVREWPAGLPCVARHQAKEMDRRVIGKYFLQVAHFSLQKGDPTKRGQRRAAVNPSGTQDRAAGVPNILGVVVQRLVGRRSYIKIDQKSGTVIDPAIASYRGLLRAQ
jgi:hypothetical protein